MLKSNDSRHGDSLERFTVSLDDALARQFEALIRKRGYENRSEAFRDLLRRELEERRIETLETHECVANLSYVYGFQHR